MLQNDLALLAFKLPSVRLKIYSSNKLDQTTTERSGPGINIEGITKRP